MSRTVAQIRTDFEHALWVVDHAMIRCLPQIDTLGTLLPQAHIQPERLAHEVLAETIRVSRRGVSRRGLTVRLWLALLVAGAFDGTATISAMFNLATGQLPRDRQWELQILVPGKESAKVVSLTAKQLYNMGEKIDARLNPAAKHLTDTQRAGRVALLASICNALKDATLVVPPTSSSYAVDESGVWAWRKAPPKPADIAPSDPLDVLTAQQRKACKEKGVVEADPAASKVAESQHMYGPKDEDDVLAPDATPFERVKETMRNAVAAASPTGDPTTPDVPATPDAPAKLAGDSFAYWGNKTHKSGRVSGYYGYALHALIRVPDLLKDQRGPFTDSLAGPLLVQEFALTPASTDIVDVTLTMVHNVIASGHKILDLLGDRHYSFKRYDRWISKLWRLGVRPVMDMRATDQGTFDYNGAMIIAGTPHCGVPAGLLEIQNPGVIASREDKVLFAAAIDARAPYAMERIQTPWQNRDGVSRYRCPASAGTVGCPRPAGSVEVAREHGLPIVTPPETETAWCRTGTATVKAISAMKYLQQHYYGSRNWVASFARRTYVEGVFGNMKNHRTGNIHRGFHQFEGQALVSLAVTAAVVAYNLRELETWYQRASILNDPLHWATLRAGEKTRGTQTRARLAAYAAHPLHQQTEHQNGFVMLTPAQQQALDAYYLSRGCPPITATRPPHQPTASPTKARAARTIDSPATG